MHAFCGCDKFLKNQDLQNLLRIFALPSPDRKDKFGEKILLLLLGDRKGRKLFMSFVYINNMRKCQKRLDNFGPTSVCTSDIS